MKQKNVKRFLATLTIASMVLAPMSVSAADSTDANSAATGSDITGDGKLEGFIDKDVFRIVLPTVTSAGVDFTADPQGLLTVTGKTGFNDGEGAVYFTNTGGTHSDTSDPIVVANKSSYDVDVTLDIALDTKGVALVESKEDLDTATVPSIYMGLKTDAADPVAITEATDAKPFHASKKVEGVAEVTSASDKGYMVSAATDDPGDGTPVSPNGNYYSYKLTSTFTDADAQKVSYALTAACDKSADWSTITDTLTAKITWKCVKAAAGSETTEPTEVYAMYYETEGAYIALAAFTEDGGNNAPAGQHGFEGAAKSDITNFKLNGNDCDFSLVDDYINVTDAQGIASGAGAGTWTFTFTFNGTDYKAVVTD